MLQSQRPPDLLEQPMVEISALNLALAIGLVLIAIGVSHWQSLGVGKDFAVGAVRSVVQLGLLGYVLVYIFALDRWYLVLSALVFMLAVATHTAVDRQKASRRILFAITGTAMLLGSGLTLAYIGAVVVRTDPWYNPRYLIPLFGMIVANSMNAAALAAERLSSEFSSRRSEVEAYLALGAPVEHASRDLVRQALRASLIPTINSLMVVGLVAIPGMMTGQIIAGASPLVAVRYQIVVMFMLAGSVTITASVMTLWYRRTFFTEAEQLKP